MDVITQLVALLAITLYLVGLVTTNFYLEKLGSADFSLIRGRYISLGVLATFFTLVLGLVPVLSVMIPYAYITRVLLADLPESSRGLELAISLGFPSLLICSFGVALLIAPWFLLKRYYVRHGKKALSLYGWDVLASVAGFALVSLAIFTWSSFPNLTEGLTADAIKWIFVGIFVLLGLLWLFLVSFVVVLDQFVEKIYPKLPVNLGGGKPKSVHLIITKEAVTGIKQLGVPMSDSATNTAAPSQISDTVSMLFEGSNAYILKLPEEGKIVQVAKDVVIGMSLHSDPKVSTSNTSQN